MWIFTVKHQPSGYAFSGSVIFRVNAGDNSGDLALRKLYKALLDKHIIQSKLSESEFMDAFEEDYSAFLPNGAEIQCVHPDDDVWVK